MRMLGSVLEPSVSIIDCRLWNNLLPIVTGGNLKLLENYFKPKSLGKGVEPDKLVCYKFQWHGGVWLLKLRFLDMVSKTSIFLCVGTDIRLIYY